MHVVIVVPCLNEEESLAATCRSLGFGAGAAPLAAATWLVLVDNGSTDGTGAVMVDVASHSPPGTVVLAREEERGYVPPRHRGVLVAREIAVRTALEEDILVLQADADTLYRIGYVDAMRRAARERPDCLVEGTTRPPQAFVDRYAGYERLAEQVDAEVAAWQVPPEHDIVVDDKVCGYRLANYFAWGGHVREFNATGDEFHAETTRLFFRAKLSGASRVLVEEAVAEPSRRKILEDPILHFATAGFPREVSWRRAWDRAYAGPRGLAAFEDDVLRRSLQEPIFQRKAHELILFGLLPLYVAMLTGRAEGLGDLDRRFAGLLSSLAGFPSHELRAQPARLLERGLSLIERERKQLKAWLAG